MTPLPLVGVMPTKLWTGANDLRDQVSSLEVCAWEGAFSDPKQTDAHFLPYLVSHQGVWQTAMPRCNKPVLPQVRAAGGEIFSTMLVLDVDNPHHAPWTGEQQRFEWLESLAGVAADWPIAWGWTLLYTTRSGARLVYVLDTPLPVDDAEAAHIWLVQQFQAKGIGADSKCSDWTRCFRLPWVVRDDAPTWESPVTYVEQLDARLPVASLGRSARPATSTYAQIESFTDPKPDEGMALALMESLNPSTGRMVQSEWYKLAKARLKGRECHDCLFAHAPLAVEGSRNATLHKYVGQATSLLVPQEGTTPAHIYGLFLGPVLQLQPDAETRDWTDVLWSAVGRIWAKESAKEQANQEQRAIKAANAATLEDRVLAGMRQWCNAADLHADDETAKGYLRRHLITSIGPSYMVMSPNGFYDNHLLMASQVVPRLRILGMDALVTTEVPREDGLGWRQLPLNEITNEHVTVVRAARCQPQIAGAFIEDIDGPDAQVVIPSFRRNDILTPTFDADVDEWLQMLFGEHYALATKWISWALAFEEGPICAMSIAGGQGVGKKLLVQGLSECLANPKLADAMDLTSENQYGLLESPFLIVNEGWPSRHGGKHPADQFRSIVSGDPMKVCRKFLAPVDNLNPARVIFTANNLNAVRVLTAGRELSPQDREALAIRLLHFDVGDKASTWLRSRGGMAFTGAPGRRWIAGDGDRVSDYVVAKHFLYLHANRKGPVGSRLLIEGNSDQSVMFELRTGSGAAPLVIECIIHMLERASASDGLHIHEGKLYALTSAVLSYYRERMAGTTREKVTANTVNTVFRSLVVQEDTQPSELPGREYMGRRRWYELDAKLLLMVAQRDGWSSKKLEALVHQQQATSNGVRLVSPAVEGAYSERAVA